MIEVIISLELLLSVCVQVAILYLLLRQTNIEPIKQISLKPTESEKPTKRVGGSAVLEPETNEEVEEREKIEALPDKIRARMLEEEV